MKNWKINIISILGITAFWILFSLLFAVISGDFKESFFKVATWIFVLFVAPIFISPIIYLVLKFENYYSFTLCFYYGGLAIIAFVNKVIRPVENVDQIIICFFTSFLVCYAANKIIKLKKDVSELIAYKEMAEPYMEFFEQKADKCGMSMYDYLESVKALEKENGECHEKTD